MRQLFAIVCMVSALFFVGCNHSDDVLTAQQTRIVSFLEGSHNPRLIPYSQVASSLDENPPFYTMFDNSTFLYIQDYYNTEREDKSVVKSGDRIKINFSLYDFSAYSISGLAPFYTNDPQFKDVFVEAGMNVEYWSFEPLSLTLNEENALKGISSALVGCREGDVVEVYMAYNMAYGSRPVGVTNKEAAIAFFCTILEIEN